MLTAITQENRFTIVAVLVAAAAGVMIGMTGALGFAGIVALIVIVASFFRPAFGIIAAALAIPLQYWFTSDLGILPQEAVWLDELALVGLAGAIVTRSDFGSQAWKRLKPILILGACFLLLLLISSWLNQIGPAMQVQAIRAVTQYWILFLALACLPFTGETRKRLVICCLGLAFLQLPIQIYQIIAAGSIGNAVADVAFGTMGPGGANNLGLFALIYLSLGLGVVSADVRPVLRKAALVFSLAMLAVMVLSQARFVYFLLPVILLVVIRRFSPRQVLLIGGILALLAGGIFTYLKTTSMSAAVLSPSEIVAAQKNPKIGNRLYMAALTQQLLTREPLGLAFGLGPGAFGSYTSYRMESPLVQTYVPYRLQGQDSEALYAPTDSQLIASIAEWGLIGTGIYAAILVATFLAVASRTRQGLHGFWAGFARGYRGVVVVMIAGVVTANVWEIQYVSAYFWMFGGLLAGLSPGDDTSAA